MNDQNSENQNLKDLDLKIIEKDTRLSESCLWDSQKNFYLTQGMNAWNGQVPFFITSNIFFAQESARVLAAYCRDLLAQKDKNKLDLAQPIYILELGAGTGQFSFYCLQELMKLWEEFDLKNLKFIYLLTDLSPENIRFCESHPNFKPWKNNPDSPGKIKFLVLESDDLSPLDFIKNNPSPNPILTIANYLFDSLRQDAFSVHDEKISEVLLNLEAPKDNFKNGVLNNLENLKPSFYPCGLSPEGLNNYYENKIYNLILKIYQKELQEGCFLIPIGALDLLNNLLDISRGNLLLLATDKGYSSIQDFEDEEEPSLVSHGSFSFGVNFHALGLWAEESGGDVMEIPVSEGIKTSVILWEKNNLNNFNLKNILKNQSQEFALVDYFNFYQNFKNAEKLSIDFLLSVMRWSRWEPYIFAQFSKKIMRGLSQSSANIITGFIQGIDELLNHMYELPYGEDLYLPIAVLLHSLHFYERALALYQLSESRAGLGVKFIILFNQGLCYSQLGDDLKAQEKFNQAKLIANPEELKRLEKWLG